MGYSWMYPKEQHLKMLCIFLAWVVSRSSNLSLGTLVKWLGSCQGWLSQWGLGALMPLDAMRNHPGFPKGFGGVS